MKLLTFGVVLLPSLVNVESRNDEVLKCKGISSYPREQLASNVSVLLELNVRDPMECMKECLLRTPCVGVSWRKACVLYSDHVKDSIHSPVHDTPIRHYTARSIWPSRLVGVCSEHVTKGNEKCAISATGLTHSIVTGCYGYPHIDHGSVIVGTVPGKLRHVEERLSYNCDTVRGKPTLPVGRPVCGEDGSWSSALCVQSFKSCSEVKSCNPSATDGEYFLDVNNTAVRLYCQGMSTPRPTMHITLPGDNYGQVTAPYTSNKKCTLYNLRTRGNLCGSTYWEKVPIKRIDGNMLHAARYFKTFVKETCDGGYLPFASTVDCSSKKGCHEDDLATIHINTTNSGVKMMPKSKMWVPFGAASVSSRKSNDGHVHDVTCNGTGNKCAYCIPNGFYVTFLLDDAYEPEPDSAISPQCVS